MRLGILLATASLLLVPGVWVCADYTAWQTFNYPSGYPPTLTVLDWSQTWTVNQFDPSLGTLTGVEIEWSGDASGWMKARNDAEEAGNIEGRQYVWDKLKRDTEELINWYFEKYQLWENVQAGEWTSQYNWTQSGSGSSTHTSNLSYWIGSGTLDLTASATGAWSGKGPGTLTFQTHVEKGDAYKLRYIYETTDIPEPGSMGLAALALLGLIGYRRRLARK